jgi:TolB-like protein/cytochrome c-type biogenesis protein CcmH/NrfG
MSEPTKAVFLSYAREDTDAARCIAEALRGFGVEVWFDQSELRGGDSWDAKIKKQIRECALFLPLVSAQTQERTEGYFRREWLLAVERTRDMAHGRAFIVPVVIDDTLEAEASVPEEFMRYQWTRLANGDPTPEFVAQVKRLLDGPKKPTLKADHARPPTLPPYLKQAAQKTEKGGQKTKDGQAGRKSAIPGWMWAVLGVVLVGVAVGVLTLRKPEPVSAAPVVSPSPLSGLRSPSGPPAADQKSIAVLPFENRSDDKANAFFTDGIHEDILTNLAHIAELRVVSRTSVMEYRGTTKKIRQIGQELGVAWLLEGSVQRQGNKVRVTGQLINAHTDEHVWAQSYDRDLTDVFAIQAELAKEIAGALSATLSPEEKILVERRPTANPAAYDLLLKARGIERSGNDTRAELETQDALLQSATALDPKFAGAWAALVSVHSQMRSQSYDVSEVRLAKARSALATAQKLAPNDPEVIKGTGDFYYYALRDYPAALEQFGLIARQWPNNYYGPLMIALVQRRQGRWVESVATLRRAAQLDPGSPDIARNTVISLRAMRRFDEAIVEQTRRVRLVPESLRESFQLAMLHYYARGSTQEGDALLAGPIAERAGADATGPRLTWAMIKGDLATAARLERELPPADANSGRSAVVLAALGDLAGARARVKDVPERLRARLVNEPENAGLWSALGQCEALLGHKDEALAAARHALELMPESRDALVGPVIRWGLVVALAWTGEKEAACAELRRLLAEPWQGSSPSCFVHELRTGPWLFPLKGYPAFEAILNDPKNNAPLF